MSERFSRKDLKQQDDFQRTSVRLAQWLMQRRKAIGLGLLLIVAVVSVLAGVRSYRYRQEQNAAAQLAVALRMYGAPVIPGGETSDPASPGAETYPSEEAKYEAVLAALAPVIDEYGTYPSGRAALFYRGLSLSALGRQDEAQAALLQAAETSAPLLRAMALYRLGELHAEREQYDEAIRVFDDVIDSPPAGFPVAEALAAKARTHEAAGDSQAAMWAYQRIAENHEGSVYALTARTRAEELAAVLGVDLDAES